MPETDGIQNAERFVPNLPAETEAHPKKPNPSRGTSRFSSGAPFAEKFRAWWDSQKTSARLEDLAILIGVRCVTVRFWLAARGFPRDPECEKLYTITQLDCFGPGRDAARAEHQRPIPREVKKERREAFRALSPAVRCARGKSARAARHRRVSDAELAECRADVRKAKTIRGPKFIVCLECGQLWRDLSGHLGIHGMTEAEYKEKFGVNRGTSLRSVESSDKQAASMKSSGHRTPARSREFMMRAIAASLANREPGRARLEERLNRRGRKLKARPSRWKRNETGEVVTDARIAQLRLRGKSAEEIARSLGMSLTAVFFRLKRMGFPRRARVFVHGEPVGAKHFLSLLSDFGVTVEEAARRIGVGVDWADRLRRGRSIEWFQARVAKRILKAREELIRDFRMKPAAGKRGGRPKRLTPSDEADLRAKYDPLREELSALRDWIREAERAPSLDATWKWLCEQFREGKLRTLQFWPQFFAWIKKDYSRVAFLGRRERAWIPRDLTIQFLGDDYGASEDVIAHVLTHPPVDHGIAPEGATDRSAAPETERPE